MTAFCDSSNIPECIQLLSAELQVIGFSDVTYNENYKEDIIPNLVNISWALVGKSKKYALQIGDLNKKIICMSRNISSLEDNNKKLDSLLTNSKGKVLELEENLSKTKAYYDSVLSELKNKKKYLHELEEAITGQKLNHEHAIRRNNTLIEELQAKLFKIVEADSKIKTDSSPHESKSEMTPDGSLHTDYILSLRNNIDTLLNENVNLRSSIASIYFAILRKAGKGSDSDIGKILYKLPYQNLIDTIENRTKKLLGELLMSPLDET